jgi:hypothetical protein
MSSQFSLYQEFEVNFLCSVNTKKTDSDVNMPDSCPTGGKSEWRSNVKRNTSAISKVEGHEWIDL